MSCDGNNATPPSPAIAPGSEEIDPAKAALEVGRRGMDPRVLALVPSFDAPFFQAGLAGYSDAAMRLIARRHGCPFCVTESLLDRMLLGGGHGFDKADLELIRANLPSGEDDLPLAGQIIGSDPDEMAISALKMIEQGARPDHQYRSLAYGKNGTPEVGTDPRMSAWAAVLHEGDGVLGVGYGKAGGAGSGVGGRVPGSRVGNSESDRGESIASSVTRPTVAVSAALGSSSLSLPADLSSTFTVIDVNLACPVKKIKNKGRGGHWLSNPDGAIEILKAVRQALPPEIPCTVKMRRAFDDTPEQARNFERIFDAVFELGYAWATVHARTVEQKYMGPSRWTFLRDLVARRPDCTIFGSGDVWEVADIFRMIGYTGVSGVSVARGCIGNPWIFRQARQMMAGEPPSPPTIIEQRGVLADHFQMSIALSGERAGSRMMRKFGIRFASHHPKGEEVRQRMIAVASVQDWLQVLEDYY